MIDIHNHLLINVDDGPSSTKETVFLLQQAQSQGITDIICTPHHHSPAHITPSSVVYEKLSEVKNIIEDNNINITVHPGQEIRINDDIINELDNGEAITLANGKYVLVEFSFTELKEDVEAVFQKLRQMNLTPIIAHPERCQPLVEQRHILKKLINDGAIAQVTAASVCGDLGTELQTIALDMIENGDIHIVSSDAHHAEVRPFRLKQAYDIIEEQLGISYVEEMKHQAEIVLTTEKVNVD